MYIYIYGQYVELTLCVSVCWMCWQVIWEQWGVQCVRTVHPSQRAGHAGAGQRVPPQGESASDSEARKQS